MVEQMLEVLSQPWPWYLAGPAIALVLLLVLWFGESFGVSSTLRITCAIGGAGRCSSFFDFNWRRQGWNMVFVLGTLIGGIIAANWLGHHEPLNIDDDTLSELKAMGIDAPGHNLLPPSIFSWQGLLTPAGFTLMVIGGFLVGFGARYAGGCTSGHAISGLSNLQLPSLLAVIGFFTGGIIASHWVLPMLLN